jgi:transcriptional regulator with XRE-family HTH domain
MLTNTNSNLWRKLSNKEYRASFAALQLKRGVPFQIQALLKNRGWTQEQLAQYANLTQGVVSRAQNRDYGNLTINTISRIASGFDVAFVGRFVPFSALVDWFENLSEEDAGNVEPFEKEYKQIVQGIPRSVRRPKARRRSAVPYKAGTLPSIRPNAGADQFSFVWPEPQPTRHSDIVSKILKWPTRMRGTAASANVIQAPAYTRQRLAGGP